MSFQEKNIAISLVNFSLILIFYLISLFQIVHNTGLNADQIFRLWGMVVLFATIGTVVITIATHITTSVIQSVKANKEQRVNDIQDERDQFIILKGTNVAYRVSTIGVALSMLTLVFGQPPLVMFTLLIFFGISAQIIADIARLYFYRRGF